MAENNEKAITTEQGVEPEDVRPPYFGEPENYVARTATGMAHTLVDKNVVPGEGGLRTGFPRIFKESFDDLKGRRGRRPYERVPITVVAEEAIAGGIDPSLDAFRDRVRSLLELQHILTPGNTVLEEICAPIYKRALAGK
jgi:hypothetical protein